jgi:hypothetical protein
MDDLETEVILPVSTPAHAVRSVSPASVDDRSGQTANAVPARVGRQLPAATSALGGAAHVIRHIIERDFAVAESADFSQHELARRLKAVQKRPLRSTFPGSTSFKALCNSYLRKLLRGEAPDSLYWVAQAALPDGDRVLARLRLTFAIEDVCVEQVSAAKSAATVEVVATGPLRPHAV